MPSPKRVGGYFAKSCTEKVLKDNWTVQYGSVDRIADSEFAQTLADSGNLFESHILTLLTHMCQERLSVIGIDRTRSGLIEKEASTFVAVMDPAVKVIFNPRIGAHFEALLCEHRGEGVRDLDPLRVSEPDMLIRLDSGLVPVDVKDHATFKAGGGKRSLTTSTLVAPSALGAWEAVPSTLRPDDWLQLAHYYRHLETLGLAHQEPIGAILGRSDDPMFVWSRLDAQGRSKPLETYDEQIAERVAVRDVAIRLNAGDPTAQRPEHPGWFSDCKMCAWRDICDDELTTLDHLSLLPQMGREAHQKALDLGLPTTRTGLAELSLDEVIAKGWTGTKNVSAYWAARAQAEGRMILRSDEAAIAIPEYDIEVDFDLENSLQGWSASEDTLGLEDSRLYMYSIVVTQGGNSEAFQFDRYAGTDEDELGVYLDTWAFCQDLIEQSIGSGKSIRFFHYTQPELNWPRRLSSKYLGVPDVPTLDQVESFFEYLTDLSPLATKGRAWPTSGVGLKPLAKHTGYVWESDKAGGDQSTVWFATASSPESTDDERNAALASLRQYGMDDVWAQLHLRRSLRGEIALPI